MMAVDLRETEWSNKEDFMIWLQSEGVSAATIRTLEGKICSYIPKHMQAFLKIFF